MNDCEMCAKQYARLLIKQYTYWRVELRSNQNYVGWCFIILERHAEDLLDVNESELIELVYIATQLRNSLKKSFNPSKFNYASLGNKTNHVHLQVIPRYEKPVKFENITFYDKNWGENYSPWDKNFEVSQEVVQKIIDTIKSNI